MTEPLTDEKLHQLEGVVAKYLTTHQAHLANPLDGDTVEAWDEATRQLMAVINNDEVNIIAHRDEQWRKILDAAGVQVMPDGPAPDSPLGPAR